MKGPRWACAATAPGRGSKKWITEGGINCPCIVRYPPFHPRTTPALATVMDILPTILDLAGVSHPGTAFRGRQVVLPRGRSWRAHLEGRSGTVHEDLHVHGWELFGQRAIRMGRWKAVWIPPPQGRGAWELFDVDEDPGEVRDRAVDEAARLGELVRSWEVYFAETGMMAMPAGMGV